MVIVHCRKMQASVQALALIVIYIKKLSSVHNFRKVLFYYLIISFKNIAHFSVSIP